MHQLLCDLDACRKRLKVVPSLSQRNAGRHQPGLDRQRMGTNGGAGEERMTQPIATVSPIEPPPLTPCSIANITLGAPNPPLACLLLTLNSSQIPACLLCIVHAPLVLLVRDSEVPCTLYLPLELEPLLLKRQALLGEICLASHLTREFRVLVVVRMMMLVVVRAHPSRCTQRLGERTRFPLIQSWSGVYSARYVC